MATLDTITKAERRAKAELSHALASLARATTEAARKRHERRIATARARMIDADRQRAARWCVGPASF